MRRTDSSGRSLRGRWVVPRALIAAAAVCAAVSGCGGERDASTRTGAGPEPASQRLAILSHPDKAGPVALAMSQAFLNSASRLLELGRFDAAVEVLTDALIADPGNAQIYFLRAGAHLRRQRVGEALADLSRAVESDPRPMYLLSRCGAYFMTGEFDAAVSDCTETIRRAPMELNAYFLRGASYYSQGEFERALSDALTVLMIRPDDANARHLINEILAAREIMDRGYPTAPDIKTSADGGA